MRNLDADVQRSRTVCFRCYRTSLDRDRAIRAAGQIDTASEARFQEALPFEPVNRPRLDMLRMEHAAARVRAGVGAGQFVDRRRQAQIAARHALERITAGEKTYDERRRAEASAVHAAELQLPDAWLPFVVAR